MTTDSLERFRKLVEEWHPIDWGLYERDLLRDVATELRGYQREFGDLPDWRQSPEWRRPQ
jgi:hypothetical protein